MSINLGFSKPFGFAQLRRRMGFAVSFFESGLAQMHLDLGSLQTEVSGLLLHVADGEVEMLRLAQHGNFISLKTGDFGWTKVL